MTCLDINKQIRRYAVFEYDNIGVAHNTDKVFVLNSPIIISRYGDLNSEVLVLSFFQQMFKTINTPSGFSARLHRETQGEADSTEVIYIRWKTDHWKLVRI